MRPSTSMQAQLRPISPSPPRKTTRTGDDALGRVLSASQATGWTRCDRGADGRQDLGGLAVELGGRLRPWAGGTAPP